MIFGSENYKIEIVFSIPMKVVYPKVVCLIHILTYVLGSSAILVITGTVP